MTEKSQVAIVGMAGIFPGAINIASFWENIVEKKNTVIDIPDDRLILPGNRAVTSKFELDRSYSKKACLITSDQFPLDAQQLKIDPLLLNGLDPVHRLSLSVAQKAIGSARTNGIDPFKMGTILAAIALPTDTTSKISREILNSGLGDILFPQGVSHYKGIQKGEANGSRTTFYPASLINAALGFTGESYTLDAACASSLYAIKLGCDQLLNGKADLILAGGVSRPDCLYTQIGFSQLRALSKSGRCAPFDRSADGLVVGEGAGIVVLKRLSDAVKAKDTIFGIIHGIGLSNDIGGNLLAPNQNGQLRAMHAAYKNAGWDPFLADHIECHGAGTPVGDKIELQSLAQLRHQSGKKCAIGSVKSNIGHLLTAAGAAGMIKTLMALYHKTLPPSLNFTEPADNSPLLSTPIAVQQQSESWQTAPGTPLRSAVSAFGFGGINAHLLVEGGDTAESHNNDERRSQILLSSKEKATGSQINTYIPSDRRKRCPLAIVGLATHAGNLTSLSKFEEALKSGNDAFIKRPEDRFKHLDGFLEPLLKGKAQFGAFIHEIAFNTANFHMPPNEIIEILPQHILMLGVARKAILDARLPLREKKERMGTIIGAGFDFEASHFHFRWNLYSALLHWNEIHNLRLSHDDIETILAPLSDHTSDPLNATRTMGALPSIAASRIAREFQLGGLSFTVAADELSGLKALEIARDSLEEGTVDTMLVGAVDLTSDLRNIVVNHAFGTLSHEEKVRPFDINASGTLTGDGAAALIVKRYEDAISRGDTIYARIDGMGRSQKSHKAGEKGLQQAYIRSLDQAARDARVKRSAIGYFEGSGSGNPERDEKEISAIVEFLSKEELGSHNQRKMPCALGSVKGVIGNCGAASGLLSLAKTALMVQKGIIPPLTGFETFKKDGAEAYISFPRTLSEWHLSGSTPTRIAAVAEMTVDGAMGHIILSACQPSENTSNKNRDISKDEDTARSGGSHFKVIRLGGKPFSPELKHLIPNKKTAGESSMKESEMPEENNRPKNPMPPLNQAQTEPSASLDLPSSHMIDNHQKTQDLVTDTHNAFLEFSADITHSYGALFDFQNRLMAKTGRVTDGEIPSFAPSESTETTEPSGGDLPLQPLPEKSAALKQKPLFDRTMCLEFARGSVGAVLGAEFAEVDTHAVRVRLPDEPLMLVDRIMAIEGEKRSLTSGRIVTEHDVFEDAWYLDGNRAPVCISVEAGQADLFLSSYLGIDHQVKGKRAYRLLDATISFHRGLPEPSETIVYDIHIDRFVNQGETYMFFFRFTGTIDGEPLITMKNGCAGFFTDEEVQNSGGIILTEEERNPSPMVRPDRFQPFVPILEKEAYGDDAVEALRRGDLAACFGKAFEGLFLPDNLKLPSGRMRLVHRVLSLDLDGGQYGLGSILAEADIHPDDWFLTCHFVDDKVMPGTLMYECCAHTLRIFLLRMGWITPSTTACFEPIVGGESALRCRGPVTPDTQRVHYEIHIKTFGEGPEPFVIADAHMAADGHPIVYFKEMSLKLSGTSLDEIGNIWTQTKHVLPKTNPSREIYTKAQIIAFCEGNPSEAFGEKYKVFDNNRFIARLPRAPYAFMDRIVTAEPPPLVLEPGGWIEAEYDVHASDWYFQAENGPTMPFCILLEIALQPCGFLAAYMGSALRSEKDLLFRNLGGDATLYHTLYKGDYGLTIRSRCTKVSEAADMIIENFDLEVLKGETLIYKGTTNFGFFNRQALANQVGLPDSELDNELIRDAEDIKGHVLDITPPITPGDDRVIQNSSLAMPSKALLMIDEITHNLPHGGKKGLGYVRGIKRVDTSEWYFKAHFYMDPVCPGSLGIESFLQLMKFKALEHFPALKNTHHFELMPGRSQWIYRGQIIPPNSLIAVEMIVTQIEKGPEPFIKADGFLSVDGLYIYKMVDFGMMLRCE